MEAVGFGMGDVTLRDLLDEVKLLPQMVEKVDLFAVIGGEAGRRVALGDVRRLRSLDLKVEYPLKESGFGKQFKQADQLGARLALIYGEDEVAAKVVKVRDMQNRREIDVPREAFFAAIQDILNTGVPETPEETCD